MLVWDATEYQGEVSASENDIWPVRLILKIDEWILDLLRWNKANRSGHLTMLVWDARRHWVLVSASEIDIWPVRLILKIEEWISL